jgi:Galactose oxidase, central domain
MKTAAGIGVSVLLCVGTVVLSSCGGGGATVSPGPTPAASYTVGGTVSGLFGAKSQVTLTDNGGDATAVSANGAFAFSKKIQGGDGYEVKVSSQPTEPPQSCSVSGGSGTVIGDVTSVSVNCAEPAAYTVGGTVTGLAAGTDGVLLEDNGGDALLVTTNGSFAFGTGVTASESFAVAVKVNPQHPIQNCTVTNGSGTVSANVTTVAVTCAAPTQFTVSGTVENLTGSNSGLILQVNGGNFFTPRASGTFMFANTVDGGEPYDVAIVQQPTTPVQICSVQNGTGEVTSNVTGVVIDCGHKEWAWISGSTATGQEGVYGTMGVAAAANNPGARQNPVTWMDAQGNFWLFGGYGYDSIGTLEPLNDLWKFSGGAWTWLGGSNIAGASGVYGTLGVSNSANIPGARSDAAFWSTGNGDVWMFGGEGFDSVGTEATLNDLWEFSDGEWTWMGGSKLANADGTYGTKGTAAGTNVPGARDMAMRWVDGDGNLWLFGGEGFDASGTQGSLNDLWEYANGDWIWVSGSSTANQYGVYGTEAVASAGNAPGGRSAGFGWSDGASDFWIFGGAGYPSSAGGGSYVLDDLWKYSNGQWTWEGGSSTGSAQASFGTQGVAGAGNSPGSYQMGNGVTDSNGNFWMFGGNGFGIGGGGGDLNDLWKFSGGEWTWVNGTGLGGTMGVYGTKNVFSAFNVVGGRINSAMWIDQEGNLWVFGGWGYGAAATAGDLNDMWEWKF